MIRSDGSEAQAMTRGREQTGDVLRIELAGADAIRRWAFGEVHSPETVQRRSGKPVPGGLFCEQLFGRERDWECACGRLRGRERAGAVCEQCGDTVGPLRRKRMGCVELFVPVLHPWFVRAVRLILDIPRVQMEWVLPSLVFVVVEPGATPLRRGQTLTEQEYRQARDQYGPGFEVEMGAEALWRLLEGAHFVDLARQLREKLPREPGETHSSRRARRALLRRLRVVEAFCAAERAGEVDYARRMFVECLPVVPPALRPPARQGGGFAAGSLNDLYARIINRNNRLKKLVELNAPEVIVRNEKRMLQLGVHALFDNSTLRRPLPERGKRPYVSLADRLRGEGGRLRADLLCKRVDYSGRAVLVPDPGLAPRRCGLPRWLAVELFQPLILGWLIAHGDGPTAGRARDVARLLSPRREGRLDAAWTAGRRLYRDLLRDLGQGLDGVLGEVLRDRVVLLSRKPGPVRAAVLAFEPVLVADRAVHAHPLGCRALGATGAGETVRVHLPLSAEAQSEARALLAVPTPGPDCSGPPPSEPDGGRASPDPLAYFRAARSARGELLHRRERDAGAADLTRRLVDALQGEVITVEDCGCAAGRSPLSCEAARGFCAVCYGADPDTGLQVEVGTPVGIRAALAIGQAAARLPTESLVELADLLDGPAAPGGAGSLLGSSGVDVAARHLEVLAARLTRWVRVEDEGDTGLLPGAVLAPFALEEANEQLRGFVKVLAPGDSCLARGEVVSAEDFDEHRARLEAQGKQPPAGGPPRPAFGRRVALGLSGVVRRAEGFLVAAGAGDPARVLVKAALARAADPLAGLTENALLGRRIPAARRLT
jgi:hypothetical protein